MAKVTVYRFKKFDIVDGNFKESPSYATLETIQQIGGPVIDGSAIEIEEAMLDGNGMYKPKATTSAPPHEQPTNEDHSLQKQTTDHLYISLLFDVA